MGIPQRTSLTAPSTAPLLLTRGEVAELLDLDACIAAVEQAFRLHAEGQGSAQALLSVHAASGGFHAKAALLELDRPFFACKINANFPANRERFGLPTIQGVVVLCDGATGALLAAMDSIEITALRTGAATALAARSLAREDSRVVGVIGCGRQGRIQVEALMRVRPVQRVLAFDADRAQATAFADALSTKAEIEIVVVDDPAIAARHADICVTCTTSRRPILAVGDVAAGTLIAAVGADAEHKHEIAPALFERATVVVDDLRQCAAIGDLHHAVAAGAIDLAAVHADLGEIVTGRKPGRRSRDEIIIFDSTGIAIEDVAAAAAVYERAVALGRGVQYDFAS